MKRFQDLQLQSKEFIEWLQKYPNCTLTAQLCLNAASPGSALRVIFYNTDNEGNLEKGKIDPFYFWLGEKE